MPRALKLLRACVSIALLFGALAVPKAHGLVPGDYGGFFFPIYNVAGGTKTLRGVRLKVTNQPSWFVVDSPISLTGPFDIKPGATVTLSLRYTIGAGYDPNAQEAITVTITSDNGAAERFIPHTKVWTITSKNGLRSYRMVCVDNTGYSCGTHIANDMSAPITTIYAHPPRFTNAHGKVFVSTHTPILVDADDDSVPDAHASGVASIGFAIDTVVTSTKDLQAYDFSALTFQEGIHTITMASRDFAGFQEVLHSSTVYVDGTPPISQIQVIGPSTTDSQGSMVLSTDTMIGLTASDPVSRGVASGLHHISFRIDGSPLAVFKDKFAFPAGHHTITYYGVDNVENVETAHTHQVSVSATSPPTIAPPHR
jgi:hypothetical protein